MSLLPKLGVSSLCILTGTQLFAQHLPPNIIMFLVDDMGWQDTSVPFYKDSITALNMRYYTPNMQRLAKMGVKFTSAYACPVSTPTRCSLMSGMNAARHRVTNWTLDYGKATDAPSNTLQLPDWNYNGIQPDTVTRAHDRTNTTLITALPQILQDHGYYTIHCGKAHFGAITTPGADPINMGFMVNIGGGANGAPGSYYGTHNFSKPSDRRFDVKGLEKYWGQDIFLTEALTREAIAAMRTPIKEKKPFYLYMSHYAVHTPYDTDARFKGRYAGQYDKQLRAVLNHNEVAYATLVTGMDKSLGDILDFLQQDPEVAQNTIILFMSDNGGQGLTNVRQGRNNRDQNAPARAGKGSAYDGGVHEPMMLYWPGVTLPGTSNDSRIIIEDFFPTILEMAQIKGYKTLQTIDGQSFVKKIKQPQPHPQRALIWHFPNLWGETQDRNEGYGASSAILMGDYRMIYYWETQERKLYNLKEDQGELTNVAASMPQMVQLLAQALTDSLIAYKAQRPKLKSTGELIPYPNQAVPQTAVGDMLKIDEKILKFSSDTKRYYYKIADHRDIQIGGCYYWTIGTHYGFKAIQCNSTELTKEEEYKQLFYFMPGSDDHHVRIFTYQGKPLDYIQGKTVAGWNGGNTTNASQTVNVPYLQYDTTQKGEFTLRKSPYTNYYGIAYAGYLLNNRGTANGTGIADMKWVVNDYNNGNNLIGAITKDLGSVFTFMPANDLVGIKSAQMETYHLQHLLALPDSLIYDLHGYRMLNKEHLPPGHYIVKNGNVKVKFSKE